MWLANVKVGAHHKSRGAVEVQPGAKIVMKDTSEDMGQIKMQEQKNKTKAVETQDKSGAARQECFHLSGRKVGLIVV